MKGEQRTPGLTVHCQEIVELVTDYLEGALDPDMTAEVEAHLQLCDGCDIAQLDVRVAPPLPRMAPRDRAAAVVQQNSQLFGAKLAKALSLLHTGRAAADHGQSPGNLL